MNFFGKTTLASTLTLCITIYIPAQAEKIFASGFEPGTQAVLEGTGTRAENFKGYDSTTGFDWVDDITADGRIFFMNYVDGTDGKTPSMLGAVIDTDPDDPHNNVLYTWQNDAEWQSKGYWSRIQGELNKCGFSEFYYKIRIRIDSNFAVINNSPWKIWNMMFEVRPTPGTREHSMTFGITKGKSENDVLRWTTGAKTPSTGPQPFPTFVPAKFNTWQTLEFYTRAGDENSGRRWFAVDGKTLVDQTLRTVEDGAVFSNLSLFKVYGSIIDVVTDPEKGNKPDAKVWYDDFELWDSRPSARVPQIAVCHGRSPIDNGSTKWLYGSTVVGGVTETVLTIRNTGITSAALGSPALSGAHAGDFELSGLPPTLEPGEKSQLVLRFAPSEAGERKATLSFSTDIDGESPFKIDLLATARGSSGDIVYPGFSKSERFILNGNAAIEGNNLILTPDISRQKGSAWHDTQKKVSEFHTTFRFHVTAKDQASDGLTFALQPTGTDELGNHGGSFGYRGISKPRVAFFFEFHGSSSFGVYSNDDVLAEREPLFEFEDSSHYEVTIVYDGQGTRIIVSRLETNTADSLYCEIDIPGILGSNSAYAGFTGGTGGGHARQEILNWTYTASKPSVTFTIPQPHRVSSNSRSRHAQWYALNGRVIKFSHSFADNNIPEVGQGVYIIKNAEGKVYKRCLPEKKIR